MKSSTTLDPVPKKVPKAKRRRSFSRRDRLTLGIFIGIPTFLHVALVWFPAFATIYLSFTYWTGIHIGDIQWAGLANYENIFFNTPIFWDALRVNVVWLIWFGAIATPLGILLAYQIDREIRGSKFYQAAYYLPVVLSLAVIGVIWNFLLRPDGLVNGLLGLEISEAVSFFGDDRYNIWVILTMASWRHIGYIMLLYLAGLKAVDASLREAASIDGATEWQTFKKVVFPAMKPVNIIVIVITIIESLRAFDLIYIIYGSSGGLPILGVLVFQNIAGEGASMKGAAYAVILFMLSIVPIITYLRAQFKEDVK
jgi:multiple sugar transport system permease protein